MLYHLDETFETVVQISPLSFWSPKCSITSVKIYFLNRSRDLVQKIPPRNFTRKPQTIIPISVCHSFSHLRSACTSQSQARISKGETEMESRTFARYMYSSKLKGDYAKTRDLAPVGYFSTSVHTLGWAEKLEEVTPARKWQPII